MNNHLFLHWVWPNKQFQSPLKPRSCQDGICRKISLTWFPQSISEQSCSTDETLLLIKFWLYGGAWRGKISTFQGLDDIDTLKVTNYALAKENLEIKNLYISTVSAVWGWMENKCSPAVQIYLWRKISLKFHKCLLKRVSKMSQTVLSLSVECNQLQEISIRTQTRRTQTRT